MKVRNNYSADWAFGIIGGLEKTVRQAFPQDLRRWPLIQNFNFEAYEVGNDHFVIVLRDKLSGIPSGPGELNPFPHNDHPALPVVDSNVDQWLSYLTRRFDLRNEDAAMVLPIHDSGQGNAAADFDLFTQQELQLWDRQFQYALARHVAALKIPTHASPPGPHSITYNVTGANARVNVNSVDSSINVASDANAELFSQMLAAIRESNADSEMRAKLERATTSLQSNVGTANFGEAYRSFMSVLADHMQVLGPIVAPYLPALAKLVN